VNRRPQTKGNVLQIQAAAANASAAQTWGRALPMSCWIVSSQQAGWVRIQVEAGGKYRRPESCPRENAELGGLGSEGPLQPRCQNQT